MPFLRVVRDKRGYETTYLIHSFRDGSPQRSRVLYVFRSPGGVRVGRDVFEPDVRRQIEASNPEISFDWDSLVSSKQFIDSTPEQRRPRRRASGGEPTTPAPPPARRAETPPQPRLSVPAVVEGDTAETRMRFLAHWHGILCEQLPLRVADPARREALMTLTQRLNPAGWLDADEIAAGIQGATEALEQLSRVLSKRRRKGRRGGQREPPAAGSAEARSAGAAVASVSQDDEVEESATGGMNDQSDDEPDPE